MGTVCAISGCPKPAFGRGWCRAHHQRFLRHGDPLAGRTPVGEPMRFLQETILTYDGDDCLPWPYVRCSHGRGMIKFDGKMRSISRVVCELVHGNPPSPLHESAHLCGKGHEGCCTKGHVVWKTPAENQRDRIEHGTDSRGAKHWNAKLSEHDVRDILSLRDYLLQKEIAELFDVSAATVGAIFRGRTWGIIRREAA